MKEKKWMLQYFHERTCRAQSLEEFEAEAKKAAELGAEYIFLSEIPKRKEEWTCAGGDPYPNWGMLQTSLFKLALPEALTPWMDAEYADENRKLLKKRSEIAKRYGLKAAMILIDPFYLPEEAYLAHPDWRGPRCDHPRRSRRMYFSPCVDAEGVRQLYREALSVLWNDVDVHYMQIITNDSGAGICWTEGLYAGKNGPKACRHIMPADRLAGFLQIFQESAKALGHDLLIDLTSDILGFKEPDPSMISAYAGLEEGQLINGRNRDGKRPVWQYQFMEYEHVRPLRKIPFPAAVIRQLWEAERSDAEYIRLIIPENAYCEYEAALKSWRERKGNQYGDMLAVCLDAAKRTAGEENASALMEAWIQTQEAVRHLIDIQFDNFVMMPLISQRLINRPLVPCPDRLTEEETAYFWPYLFQAVTREQALDYMNIQGMEFVRGFCACRMMSLIAAEAQKHLEKAISAYKGMVRNEVWRQEYGVDAVNRLNVLRCLIRTLVHAARYQEILDRTDAAEEPERQTIWPVLGDERLLCMNEICREEIDNTFELFGLISERPEDYIVTAAEDSEEDIFLVGKDLPQQLLKKTRIMLAHMRDAEDIYESSNK